MIRDKSIEIFYNIGKTSMAFFASTGSVTLLFILSVRAVFKRPMRFKELLKQMEFIGVKSVPIIILAGGFTGMVFGLQTYVGFRGFGAESMSGSLVTLAMVSELGPVLTGLMVASRAGSAMAAELGTMRVTEQIDALSAMAVDPVHYLVTPRLLASIIVMPLLNIICIFAGLIGGYVVNVMFLGVNGSEYIELSNVYVKVSQITDSMIKALIFGILITIVSTYKGINADYGAEGVGKATTEAVVISCVLVLFSDYIITTYLVGL